ncbi:glucagon receptor-like, partial [Chiloscyllium punctatum]|uniref:glucagon receptor-like n=1 Tax=Chiloscyllium punctatum TaxID=137246 RepID=UPI003B6376EE
MTMPGTAVLFLSLAALALPQIATAASKLHKTVLAWRNYREDCLSKIQQEPKLYGTNCNRTFDLYACWPDGEPNSTVSVPCPWYLPWYDSVRERFAYRRCDANGYWVLGNHSQPWRDLSDCQFDPIQLQAQVQSAQILHGFRVMYSVGYSLSVAALTIACIILRALRKLRCPRNYIHLNLFASFIVRGVSILSRDQLLWGSYDQGTEFQGTLRVRQSEQ